MEWIGPALASGFWELEKAFDARPFSAAEARGVLGAPAAQANLRLARLANAGWIVRTGRGQYVSFGPHWVRSRTTDPLGPLRSASFFAELAVSLATLLHLLGPRLRSVALFGSCARGTPAPESDIDLLIVGDPLPSSLEGRLEELRPVTEAVYRFARTRPPRRRELHLPQIVPFTPAELHEEPPLLLDLTQDARILFDPEGILTEELERLRRKLARLGSRRVRTAEGWEYWALKPGARVGEVGEL